jgi:hypothetical protein
LDKDASTSSLKGEAHEIPCPASARSFAALPLAAIFAFGLASSANAWSLPNSIDLQRGQVVTEEFTGYTAYDEDPYHPCYGRTSGTASHGCGTRTGGPSGGLF